MARSPESHIAARALGQAVAQPVWTTVMGEGRPHTTSWEWLMPQSSPPQSLCLLSLCLENSFPGLSQSCFLLGLLVTAHMSLRWGGLSCSILGPSLISLLVSIMTLITTYKWQVYLCDYLTVVCLPHLTWSPMRLEITVWITAVCPASSYSECLVHSMCSIAVVCLGGWLDMDGRMVGQMQGRMERCTEEKKEDLATP